MERDVVGNKSFFCKTAVHFKQRYFFILQEGNTLKIRSTYIHCAIFTCYCDVCIDTEKLAVSRRIVFVDGETATSLSFEALQQRSTLLTCNAVRIKGTWKGRGAWILGIYFGDHISNILLLALSFLPPPPPLLIYMASFIWSNCFNFLLAKMMNSFVKVLLGSCRTSW